MNKSNRIVERVQFPNKPTIKLLRTAAYARVSSGKDAMLHSLSAQVSYNNSLIQSNPEWLFCGVYADEALTGTKDNRENFQRLLTECRAGNIDLIITKSISRFARNTVTLLETVRELKNLGVDVYFEEQNIHSISPDGEFMLTLLGSYAQEESYSASENQKWRIRKDFEQGRLGSITILGYERSNDGTLIIVPEEAEIVRMIFNDYLSGMGKNAIANKLLEIGFPTKGGGIWTAWSIRRILKNEKYCGDLLLQKTYRENHITKKKINNTGQLPQYYIENDHEAIIPKEIFLMVQEEIARRSEQNACFGRRKNFSANHPFSKIVFCADCGEEFRRIHWNNRGKKSIVWRCLTRLKQKDQCHARTVNEETLIEAFLDALNEIVGNSDDYMTRLKENLETAINEVHPESAAALAAKMAKLQQELIDRTERRENYDDITEEILRLRELQEQTAMDDTAKSEHKKRIRELLKFIERQKSKVCVFDGSLVKKLLEKVNVYDDYLEFRFKSGVTVSVEK